MSNALLVDAPAATVMAQEPDVSVIIVNWNTCDLLRACLRSLSTGAMQRSMECIVVDNGSTDGSQAMVLHEFPWVRLDEAHENLGFARANNRALASARGRYLLLLNSDTEVMPGALEQLLEVADVFPAYGILGPRLLNEDGSLQISWSAFPTVLLEVVGYQKRTARLVSERGAPVRVYEVDWVSGAAFLIRRETMQEVGVLDEGFFMYSEETDYCFRVVRAGWGVAFVEGADVLHLWGGSAQSKSLLQLERLYDSKLRYFEKNHGRASAWLYRSGLIKVQLIRCLQGWLWAAVGRPNDDRPPVDRLRLVRHLVEGYARTD